MNKIYIITRRVFTERGLHSGQNYINDLHFGVTKFPGFIKGTSYWGLNMKMVTISEWKNKREWEKWVNSKERESVKNNYEDIIADEDHEELFKIIKTTGFLL